MKFLIAGLGNIGAEYELTRHNIGFLVLDQLEDKFDCKFELTRHAYHTEFKYKGKSIHLIKPSTYMNLSGKAVNYWLNELKIEKKNLLVITDDIALPLGKLRMRAKGSDAGHNGLKNIDIMTDGNNYPRLRFGIGDDFRRGHQVDYVLSRFSDAQWEELPIAIENACEMALSFASIGIERTMNQYN